MACYLINQSPRVSLGGKVVEEAWTSILISLDHLRILRVLPMCIFPVMSDSNLIQSRKVASLSATTKV